MIEQWRMGRGRMRNSVFRRPQQGSIVLFVLFVCLGVAVLVQSLSVIVVCTNQTIMAEESGRLRMAEKDQGLAAMRDQLLQAWGPMPWTVVSEGPLEVEGTAMVLPESQDWVLAATVRHEPEVSRIAVSAHVERGRDGLDLPLAGLVADEVSASSFRASPWLEVEGGAAEPDPSRSGATAYVRKLPTAPVLGEGVMVDLLADRWRLDDVWRIFFREGAAGLTVGSPQVCVLAETDVLTVSLPEGWGTAADAPGLVVVTGGASLDARGRGDLYGVIVVDDGDVLLADTRLHGALFASGTVELGSAGSVAYSRPILRWATDRSLQRVRLVPGTRWERTG
jgi:hypothetical protein